MTLYNIIVFILQYILIVLLSWGVFMILIFLGLESIDYVITKLSHWRK